MSPRLEKILGTIGSVIAVCMYVAYIPQIIGNLHGHPGDWFQPLVAATNCTVWTVYALFKKHRDIPVAIANAPGIFFGLMASITALGFITL